jgi:DNA-binding CsgD family transcriptional regulator
VLQASSKQTEGPTIAIVLERSSRRNENLRRLVERYKLTLREREAVLLLIDGLTSKEIAQRMNISPHTVKGFLHFIMVKLGVTTRSGIVGKISNSQ